MHQSGNIKNKCMVFIDHIRTCMYNLLATQQVWAYERGKTQRATDVFEAMFCLNTWVSTFKAKPDQRTWKRFFKGNVH